MLTIKTPERRQFGIDILSKSIKFKRKIRKSNKNRSEFWKQSKQKYVFVTITTLQEES